MNQIEFLEKVNGLVAKGRALGGSITEVMLSEAFASDDLDGEQMLSIRSYLKSNGIEIENDSENPSSKIIRMTAAKNVKNLPSKEKKVYQLYLEELEAMPVHDIQMETVLLEKKAAGDMDAGKILTEGRLKQVVDIAALYAGHGAPLEDLVQEGNLALYLAVLEEYDSQQAFDQAVRDRVTAAMDQLVEETDGHLNFKIRMADMANQVMDLSAELAEDLNRQPTLEELAKEMETTVEEIEAVMKMSMDAMTMDQDLPDEPEA